MLDQMSVTPTHRLIRLVEQVLAGKVGNRAVAKDDALTQIGLTSIDMVNLMLAVEAEFDVMIPQSDITPANFRSVATIEAMLGKLVAPTAG